MLTYNYNLGKMLLMYNYELAQLITGEFAGKLYNLNKLTPAIRMLIDKGEIPLHAVDYMINQNKAIDNLLVYFNYETRAIFGIEIFVANDMPTLRVYKPAGQNWDDIREFCSRVYEIIPNLSFTVCEEKLNFRAKKLELAGNLL